jgi:hypothetical protein
MTYRGLADSGLRQAGIGQEPGRFRLVRSPQSRQSAKLFLQSSELGLPQPLQASMHPPLNITTLKMQRSFILPLRLLLSFSEDPLLLPDPSTLAQVYASPLSLGKA